MPVSRYQSLRQLLTLRQHHQLCYVIPRLRTKFGNRTFSVAASLPAPVFGTLSPSFWGRLTEEWLSNAILNDAFQHTSSQLLTVPYFRDLCIARMAWLNVGWLVEYGLTSHSTHYRSFRRRWGWLSARIVAAVSAESSSTAQPHSVCGVECVLHGHWWQWRVSVLLKRPCVRIF